MPSIDFSSHQQRNAFIDILEMSHMHPKHKVATRDFLRDLIANEQNAEEVQDGQLFEKDVPNYNSLPEDFIIVWLLKSTDLSSLDLGKIKNFDSQQPRQLLYFGQKVLGTCKFPESCKSKCVMTRVLDARSVQNQNPIMGTVVDNKCISDEGRSFGLWLVHTITTSMRTTSCVLSALRRVSQ